MPVMFETAREAVRRIRSGSTIMVGGFGLSGMPLSLVDAVLETPIDNLTVISNNLGRPGEGLGKWLRAGKIRKVIGTYFTTNPEVAQAHLEGKIEVELLPQGTFSEAIRAGGSGIAAFYTPTAADTELAKGKEVREFGGRLYVLERALRADVALIKAHKSDELGNLVYYKTARNFNPIMAMAADLTIAEVDEIVPAGALDPECVVTPHVFVDVVVKG